MSVENLKVIIYRESDTSLLIRYCQVEEYGSLTNCRENILSIFPELQEIKWKMYWVDEDDHKIEINDELSYSCFQMATDEITKKIYIYDGKIANFPESESAFKGKPHSVVCNECNEDIFGFRYKCVQCPDFDLCRKCEGEILHKEHVMFRIPIPLKQIPFHKNVITEFNMMNDLSTDTDAQSKTTRRRRIGTKQTVFVPPESFSTPINDSNFSELEKLNNYSRMLNDFRQMFNDFNRTFVKLLDKMDITINDIISNKASPWKSDETDLPKLTASRNGDIFIEQRSLKKVSQNYSVLGESTSNFCTVDDKEINECRKSNEGFGLRLLFEFPEQKSALNNVIPIFPQDPNAKKENSILQPDTINLNISKDTLKPVQSAEDKAPGETTAQFGLPFPHVDPYIANALTVLTNLGYRNEGNWLITLLQSVDGNIPKALDLLQHGK